MAKRSKRRVPTLEELSKPSKWRLQHGPVTAPERGTDPETGVPVQRRRAVDTLGMLLENGSITPQMHEAAEIFRTQFRAAALDGMRTMPLIRVARGTGGTLTERHVSARQKVAAAIKHVGGMDSPAGSSLWHVVGLECSIREWAMQQGWNGRALVPAHGQGILVCALGTLVEHYGLAPRSRRCPGPTMPIMPSTEATAGRAARA
jgi:hypothetical protein